jgi:hypothetical protein
MGARTNAELTPTKPDIDEAFKGSCFPAGQVRASAPSHAPAGRSLLLSRVFLAARSVGAESALLTTPIVVTGAGMRPAISLHGEWAAINDPYLNALFGFHGQEKSSGFFHQPEGQAGRYGPVEYN